MEWKALPDVGRGFGKKTIDPAQSTFAPRAEWLGISDGWRIEFARNLGCVCHSVCVSQCACVCVSNAEKSRAQNLFTGIYIIQYFLLLYIFNLLEKSRSYSAGVFGHSLPFWITLSGQLPPSPNWHRGIFFHRSPFGRTYSSPTYPTA